MPSNPLTEMRRTQNQAQSQAHAQRHTACNMCRDKKVRCDGEQPSCSKCRQSGEECVYVPVPTPTRATLANMVKELQDRLGTICSHTRFLTDQPRRLTTNRASRGTAAYHDTAATAPSPFKHIDA